MGENIIFEGSSTCCGDCGQWWSSTKWRITDKYIERQTGLCCVTVDNLQLVRIKDISFVSGKCCCSACGKIRIISSDTTDPELIIGGVPHGKEVYAKIRDAWDKASSGARLEIQT